MCFAQHNTADSRMTIKALPTNRKPAGSSRREGHSWPFLLLGPPLMAGTTSETHHVRQPRSRGFESRLQPLLAAIPGSGWLCFAEHNTAEARATIKGLS